MNHETPRRPSARRSRSTASIRNKARQIHVVEARGKGPVASPGENRRDNLLEVGGGVGVHRSPLSGETNWYEFTFDVAHPQDAMVTLRFVIEAPVPVANRLLPGSMLETRIRWREEVSRGR